jgi:predicted alpha/beta-fold hydrolase
VVQSPAVKPDLRGSAASLRYELGHRLRTGTYAAAGALTYPWMTLPTLLQDFGDGARAGDGEAVEASPPFAPGVLSSIRAFLPDLVVYVSELEGDPRVRYEYPPPFEDVIVPVGDGMRLAGKLGLWRDRQGRIDPGRPLLILVPGLFNTRHQRVVVRQAWRAFFRWGYHVLAADMRDFGETARLCAAPASVTLYEGHDVCAMARWARTRLGVRSVFASGFSYGGAVALAASSSSREGELDACVSFCPFADLGEMIRRLSIPPRMGEPSAPFLLFYRYLLRRQARVRGLGRVESFEDYIERVVAPYYGLDPAELYRQASPVSRVQDVRVPTLVLHSRDDPIVPVEHSLQLQRRARQAGNDRLRFITPARGGHYGNWSVDPGTTEEHLRRFLERHMVG